MPDLLGKITASLIDKDQDIPEGLIEKINTNIKPPSPVSTDEVYIRAMYIISDRINSFGGRFPADEHPGLAKLLIDSPVLIGHRKDTLPVARNFHAETVKRENSNWIKLYFYWLKNADKGEDLRKNIDGGIYKECSISFIFNFPECSICGSDIRECRHRPFVKYKTNTGEKKQAYFSYRQILRVLETSLVYRGSVQETSITDELFFSKPERAGLEEKDAAAMPKSARRIWDLNLLDNEKDYYVLPAYESLRLILDRSKGDIKLWKHDGQILENPVLAGYLSELLLPDGNYSLDCRLIGCRGKERQPVSELVKYLKNEKSSVRRIELKICDLIRSDDELLVEDGAGIRRERLEKIFGSASSCLVPAKKTTGSEIRELLGKRSTRYGVEIYDCSSSDRFLFTHRKLIALEISKREKTGDGFKYSLVGLDTGRSVPVASTVTSRLEHDAGDIVEVEVHSVDRAGHSIGLVHPRIIDCSGDFQRPEEIGLLLCTDSEPEVPARYSVFKSNSESIILAVCTDGKENRFEIHNFSLKLLNANRRFLADRINAHIPELSESCGSGDVIKETSVDGAVFYELDGFFKGKFLIRPVIKTRTERFLFYRFNGCLPAGNS